MPAKKKLVLSITALAIISVLLYYFVYANPNAKWNNPQKHVVDLFYKAFRTEDYSLISPLVVHQNPQMVINIRHWYGDVQAYRIRMIRSISVSEKQATVTVASLRNGEVHHNTDTLLLVKQDGGWLIKNYMSDLDYKLP